MTEKTVNSAANIEYRTAANLVSLANRFGCDIDIVMGPKRINAKSLMGVMSLGILEGAEVTIAANGPDEAQAAEEMASLLSNC